MMLLPPGEAQTTVTLRVMAQHARDAARFDSVRRLAATLRDGTADDPVAFSMRLYNWMLQHVMFRPDPPGHEYVRAPTKMIDEVARNYETFGDCDDLATLAASILLAAGMEPAFVVVGPEGDGPYSHVYYAVMEHGRWVPYDPQEARQGIRPREWSPGGKRMIYAVA